jgi:hypothetical protein
MQRRTEPKIPETKPSVTYFPDLVGMMRAGTRFPNRGLTRGCGETHLPVTFSPLGDEPLSNG